MLYVYANVKIKYGQLPAFNEAMVTVKRVMEANGWTLVGGWMTLVGDLHEVHDVWEVEDANVVPAAFAHESFNETLRLKTGRPGVESASAQKYPRRSN